MHRKICVIGAQGTGKTTLVNALIPYLLLPQIKEVARRYTIPKTPCTQLVEVQQNIPKSIVFYFKFRSQ